LPCAGKASKTKARLFFSRAFVWLWLKTKTTGYAGGFLLYTIPLI